MPPPAATDDPVTERANYWSRVSRALWFRNPTRPSRFVFSPTSPTGLYIEPLGQSGATAIFTHTKTLKAQGLPLSSGALLVDEDGRFVLCGPAVSAELLKQLAEWAKRHVSDLPAAANLMDAGIAKVAVELGNDEAIKGINLKGVEVHRDPALWADLLEPTTATVAAVLANCQPGERMWDRLSGDVPDDLVPLLLQPVAWDPNRERMDHLIRKMAAAGAGDAATGWCMMVDDGRLQLAGTDLFPDMLGALADWVRANAEQYPSLTRLANCQLLLMAEGRVVQVMEDPALWEGVPSPVVPGTLSGTAALLERLGSGEECWFWITASGNDGPFLGLARADADPDGLAFKEQIAAFYKRFPNSFQDALSGVVRRLPSGDLLFSTQETRVDHWPALIRTLVDQQVGAYPGLAALTRGTLVQMQNGQIAHTLPVAATSAAKT